ncbi:unnamed protein product [Echinostoma caproni]|uniref:Membrane-associated guanylate kinase, WW and PDZ domain-containing protein 1-like n=1 Tax=Echinostoma caproni TaxID=27848 RepID=A0A183AEP9_9TREM|nr:unnamed protein product [Echinostoma caproni]
MSVPQFLALERSGQLLESGMYKGNHYGTPRPDPNATALDTLIGNNLSISSSSSAQLTDDSCVIPPPLPPLASLSNVMGSLSTPSESSSSSTGGSQQTLPSATALPPPPPVRHSSITNQSTNTSRERLPGQLQDKMTNGQQKDESGLAAFSPPGQTNFAHRDRAGSIDLGPLSSRYDKLTSQLLSNNNYLIDCDLSGSQWKDSGIHVTNCSTSSSAATNGGQSISSDTTCADLNATVCPDRDLPYGWEVVQDPKYGIFYIDHINKRTQYEPPTEEDFALATAVRSQLWSVGGIIPTSSVADSSSMVDSLTSPDGILVTNRPGPDSKDDRVSPTTFTTDPKQIRGPLVTTTLVKSPRGFGFTVVGGADCNRLGYLQIKHLVPGGPASVNSCLDVGDVLVVVNSINVLGYTHAEIVSLFQSIPVGTSITLTVSQAYRLRRDTSETSSMSPVATSASGISSAVGLRMPAHLDLGRPDRDRSFSKSVLRAEMLQNPAPKVAIFKQPNGFGFTLADHPQGQHVKAILDPGRCGRLRVGDVVVEINDQRVKEVSHAEVVQILKQCPVGQEARLLVQRGGLYTSPLSLLTADHGPLKHASVIGDKDDTRQDDEIIQNYSGVTPSSSEALAAH